MNEKQTVVQPDQSLRPTKKQKELLGFIEQFVGEHGYSPSYREIMNGLQYTSVATVALHVGNLIKRGHLRKRDRSARSLEVVYHENDSVPTPLKTNEIKPGDEKWLVGRVDQQLSELEALPSPDATQIADIQVLVAALRILGLDGAAQSFANRLSNLTTLQK